MAESKKEIYAACAIACAALVVAVAGFVRDRRAPPPAPTAAAIACVDAEARATIAELRREIARNAALATRLSALRPPDAPSGAPPPDSPPRVPNVPVGTFLRFSHVETSNPAVTAVQKEDGTYDVKTSDPSLAGTVVMAKATTADGQVMELLLRVPP